MAPIGRLMGRGSNRNAQRVLGIVSIVLVSASVIVSLTLVPPDAVQGQVQRLMYVHVPAAWLAYLSFLVVFIGSVAFLITKQTRWDRLAAASAEVGVLFTALTIILGSLWGKPVWGTWWTWDPRLTTTAILLLIYLGYLAVRRLPASPKRRARWAAVIGIVGFLDVPIVHLSVVWWRSLHQPPTILRPGAPTIAGSMLAALLLGVVAFSVLYTYLMVLRLRVARIEERQEMEPLTDAIRNTLEEERARAGK